jgi:prepilin-type N-terminal cleavage/methylation domain-containing protein
MRKTNANPRGFTILELMIGMALFLVLSSAILSGMASLQKNYRNRELRTTMQQRLRAAMELMAQEIGQAGLQSSTVESNDETTSTQTLARYTLSSVTATSAVVSPSAVGMYVGEWLQVGGGSTQDPTQITAITGNTIAVNFNNLPHADGTVAFPMGVFPHGILAGLSGDPSTGGDANHASKLAFYGEINGPSATNGNGLVAVEYSCPTPGSSNKSLMRTEWNALTGVQLGTSSLIDNVTSCFFCWPGSTASACPTGTTTPDTVQLAASGTSYPMITQVGFSVTVQETDIVSGTQQLISITKSYSNVQPRNIIAADAIYNLACSSATNYGSTCNGASSKFLTLLGGELQPDPPGIAIITASSTQSW